MSFVVSCVCVICFASSTYAVAGNLCKLNFNARCIYAIGTFTRLTQMGEAWMRFK